LHQRLDVVAHVEDARLAASQGVIYSQSVKTTEAGGPRGFHAAKKIKGRKRHVVTDTIGLLVGAQVHVTDVQDRDGAPLVLATIRDLFRGCAISSLYFVSVQLLIRRLARA
jgi:hypothetical protein